jgi:hypothetical protein
VSAVEPSAQPSPDAPTPSLRVGVLIAVAAAVQVVDVLLDRRVARFVTEDGRSLQDLSVAVGNAATVLFWVLAVALTVVALRHRRTLDRSSTSPGLLRLLIVFLSAASLNVLLNITTLVVAPTLRGVSQPELIVDLVLIYASTTMTFSVWYQLADVYLSGGAFDFAPDARYPDHPPRWFDYLSLSFYTNSTFGPTLESVRTRPAKALMMVQTSLSLLVLVVLIARIIKAN